MIRTAGPGHLEDRTVSAANNPYLAFAAYLTAGLDGVRNRLDPGKANLGNNMYELGLEEIQRRGIRLLPQSALRGPRRAEERPRHPGRASVSLPMSSSGSKEAEYREYHSQVTQWGSRPLPYDVLKALPRSS